MREIAFGFAVKGLTMAARRLCDSVLGRPEASQIQEDNVAICHASHYSPDTSTLKTLV